MAYKIRRSMSWIMSWQLVLHQTTQPEHSKSTAKMNAKIDWMTRTYSDKWYRLSLSRWDDEQFNDQKKVNKLLFKLWNHLDKSCSSFFLMKPRYPMTLHKFMHPWDIGVQVWFTSYSDLVAFCLNFDVSSSNIRIFENTGTNLYFKGCLKQISYYVISQPIDET